MKKKEGVSLISTKGRYAIRILMDLAEHGGGDYIPMKDVAKRQGISLKYIERILPTLKAGGLIDSVHGKGGGYRLVKEPDGYNLWEILQNAEGDLAPVACLRPGTEPCERAAECKTLAVWQNYYTMTKEYFSSITLADLINRETPNNYVI